MMFIPLQLEGFDVPDAVARMLDRPELWWQSVGLFIGHFADWNVRWAESLGDRSAERRCVHAIRSAATNIGAIVLAERAARLECGLNDEAADPGDLKELRGELAEAFARTWQVCSEAWQQSGGEFGAVT